MGGIIIAGTEFNYIPVKTWHETGWDATVQACVRPQTPCVDGITPYGDKTVNKGKMRYSLRPALRQYGMTPKVEQAKAVINQFVFHHDGCKDSAMCWEVLHNERGLSCHFLVDNNGDIYQTIDLAFAAWHAKEFNPNSIGVEISNRGEAAPDQRFYDKLHQKRDITTCTINGSKILTFAFTEAQRKALLALCDALTKILPNIPIEYPQAMAGQQSWDTLQNPGSFKGYIGHYHLTQRKWDPGPFDFKKFCEDLRGQRCFPLWTGKTPPKPNERPYVPSNGTDLNDQLKTLYARNEDKADGGYFPVGPWGEYRLWHGGVHLVADEKETIWSPFAGRIVAARMGRNSPIGSVNFVLVRHDMTVGDATMRFFALYMHLYDELKEKDPAQSPAWMKKDDWQKYLKRTSLKPDERKDIWDDSVDVALLDIPLGAGDVIGRVGKAGPDGRAQIHFEIFSENQVLEKFPGAHVDFHDGSGTGRFCDDKDIIDKIDTSPKDGKLTKSELTSFFSSPGERDQFHHIVTYNVSEWTAEPSWVDALSSSQPDFRALSKAQVEEMIDEQITPGLWWTDKVAQHCKLPVDGLVNHYNPIDFVGFINEEITMAAATAPPPPNPSNLTGAGSPPKGVTDDYGDKESTSAVSLAQINNVDPSDDLKLEDMVNGYP